MSDNPKKNANVVEALESAVRAGNHALNAAPDLMCRAIEEGCWKHFVTKRGEVVTHDSFSAFLTALPLRGLGVSIDEARRLVAHEPHALVLFNMSVGVVPAKPAGEATLLERPVAAQTAKALERLLEVDPQLHEEVRDGVRSANSALVAAGLRPRVFTVKAGDADATVRALRRHLTSAQLDDVKRLLAE